MAPPKRKTAPAAQDTLAAQWPIKKPDGEPLWRKDLQWDLLTQLFGNSTYRFTPPTYPSTSTPLFPTDRTWSFAELYLDCIANSSKATRNLKDKMSASQEFAVNFAKLCLLVNVGRINTTIAFFPEMRTAMRTYHPLPTMQMHDYSRQNLQDAPRLKSQLKAALLPQESKDAPETLAGIAYAAATGKRPSTSVVNLMFTMFAESGIITSRYMPDGFECMDLFWPNTIPAAEKANALLWIIHRLLEHPDTIADLQSGDKIPVPFKLTRGAAEEGNVDTAEEIAWGAEAQKTRMTFVGQMKQTAVALNQDAEAAASRRSGLRRTEQTPVREGSASVAPEIEQQQQQMQAHAYLEAVNATSTRLEEESAWASHMLSRQKLPHTALQDAWSRAKADLVELRDVLYDSDEDEEKSSDWSQPELRQRINVFHFNSDKGQQIVRFGMPEAQKWKGGSESLQSTDIAVRQTSLKPKQEEVPDFPSVLRS